MCATIVENITIHNVLLDQRVRMNVDSLPNVSEFNSIVSAGMALTMEQHNNNDTQHHF